MANVMFKRGTQAALNALSTFVDGAFYLTTDTDRLYVAQSANELVELNKSITIVDQWDGLPRTKESNSGSIKGQDVAAGQFYYITNKNILAVCTSATSEGIEWAQVNPNENTVTDFVIGNVLSSDDAAYEANTLKYPITVTQTTGETEVTSIKYLKISQSDVTSLVTDVQVGIQSNVVSGNAEITMAGTGIDANAKVTIAAGDNISIAADGNNKFIINGETLTSPAVTGATSVATADINLGNDSVAIKTGTNLSIDNSVADEISISHTGPGTQTQTYGPGANTTTSMLNTASNADVTITVPSFGTDANGHVASGADRTYTVHTLKDASFPTAADAGKITFIDSNNDTVTSTTKGLYYTMTIDGVSQTVYNSDTFGSFYSASRVDELLNSINAMTYKGTIGSNSINLPYTSVKVGDTYMADGAYELTVHRSDSTLNETIDVTTGTLVIARGTETNGIIAQDDIEWDVVQGENSDTTYSLGVSTVNQNATMTLTPSTGTADSVTFEGDNYIDVSADNANETINVAHKTVNGLDTTTTFGGTSAVPSLTVDAAGHIVSISSVNLNTLTLKNVEESGAYTSKLTIENGAGQVELKAGTDLTVIAGANEITFNHAPITTTPATITNTILSDTTATNVITGVTVSNGHVTGLSTTPLLIPEVSIDKDITAITNGISITDKLNDVNTSIVNITSNNLALSASEVSGAEVKTYNVTMNLEWGNFN